MMPLPVDSKFRPSRKRKPKSKADEIDDRLEKQAKRLIIGVDGEGHDTPDGRHIYTYLAAVDEFGELRGEAYNPDGLTHEQCVSMLLSLPHKALKFGFMFSYDVTKIIEELPEVDRYYLMRPAVREEIICQDCKHKFRRGTECPECASPEIHKRNAPVVYRRRKYDYFNGSLMITERNPETGKNEQMKIWDCFRFFGCAFVVALDGWKVGTKEQVARITAMKGKRGALEKEDPEEVKAYCREECHLLAVMMRKVITAHTEAAIPLERYDGAGSTASALLKSYDVASYKGPRHRELDSELGYAIACAFFGGRFEDSMVGLYEKQAHGFDISSAYPFALSALPCLEHGRWRKERATLELLKRSQLALARFYVKRVPYRERLNLAWGPLPFRDEKGSISYGTNFFGWAWGQELIAALEGWPDLVELCGDAWIYETDCDHKPFKFMPNGYRMRLAWGKEGAGIALKLGMNASYGKTAQSIGDDPPFQSWIWAGACTATTRGQILRAIKSAQDPWNVFTIATDGIYGCEQLPIQEPPWDTGTGDLRKETKMTDGTKKMIPCPLGGWEHKEIPEGIFVVKPGLYYRLNAEFGEIRARGVGRREIHERRQTLIEEFLKWDRQDMSFNIPVQSRRFYGAKHSIYGYSSCLKCKKKWPSVPEFGCPKCGEIGDKFETSITKRPSDNKPGYGLWDLRLVKIGFDPYPKREQTIQGHSGTFSRLTLRDLEGRSSAAYDVGTPTLSPEGQAARDAQDFDLHQPDYG